ncbi:response regulator transcription factor [Siphonobacter aquaeclarae]|jgi:DNA-binding response OmpR family regulator|uniref:DNA-binding response regulator, OmpR family, contains REC and winged-helix (WHTH) domain n=1 Tax=Siphonobacter aquaeclarae TaxID=563176 RepID=A0A1G9SPS6_9BACT|nr:response regulator transcription factor [Siphonobacter aquaeclarae]MBO9636568.1 response regulator transcription factor [Siphonobacter aquaeclarae]SDM37360.1 DNA-binding response regulator, OmpR family, contains REC and winged-helix (wHTH) domain [Siphonobacter aquaeclarae]
MKMLVVEDEQELAESITSYLTREGYRCEMAATFREADEKLYLYEYDCVIVDLTLPGGDGLDLIETLKKRIASTGIIIISARNALEDKIRGLEVGSDDYLTKPFHLSELNARVKSLIRRRNFGGHNEIRFREIEVHPHAHKVFVGGQETVLSRKEYDLLLYFLSNLDVALTKASIAEHLWGDNIDSADSLDMVYSHIKNLRRKLVEKGSGDYIRSIYGIGYKFGPQ